MAGFCKNGGVATSSEKAGKVQSCRALVPKRVRFGSHSMAKTTGTMNKRKKVFEQKNVSVGKNVAHMN
jgi:hypothetical protein